ncbi:4870_t:CDS:2 [Paraglomus occultum]|uniref:4870_t:CDS:1 n=1 Tax=Paraglomus occultum TaxID=144539 RepID=A0A9N8ZPY2_9GLOM|nr:4870_t:CDS:2 [Paraglomus occultum]
MDIQNTIIRSFPDNPEARKKHLEGAQHQLNVKHHYDAYKDPVELLLENARKPPCRRFLETGFCPFGLSCRYSHVPPHIDMSTIDPHSSTLVYLSQNQHLLNKRLNESNRPPPPPPVKVTRYKLPPGLPKDLPPSLRLPPPGGYDYSNVAEW